MVDGFHHPEGDVGGLDITARRLGLLGADLKDHNRTVANGFQAALRTWRATRAADFRDAGTGIEGALDGAVSIVSAAEEQVSNYVRRLRNAREDIDELRRQAQSQLSGLDTLKPDDPEWATTRSRVNGAVERLRDQAEEIRNSMRREAGATASALDAGTRLLLPDSSRLSPEQVAQKVHGSSPVAAAGSLLDSGVLTEQAAWKGLSDVTEAGSSLAETFVDKWGGFKPPTADDPVSMTLFTLGQAGFGASSVASWLADQRYAHFRPINSAGQTIPKGNLGFWRRLKLGAGRLPTSQGLTPWQRVTRFDPKGHFSARPWYGAQHRSWNTTSKWLGRAGVVVTGATSAWGEWQKSANYPTDERIGRTATVTATTTTGAVVGAKAGAWAGGAIGTAICPGIGTVIGAGVGGLIGGFVGSEAGAWVGDQLKDIGGEVGDVVGDAVDSVGDAVDSITPW